MHIYSSFLNIGLKEYPIGIKKVAIFWHRYPSLLYKQVDIATKLMPLHLLL